MPLDKEQQSQVREIIKEVFTGFAPILKDIALTPDKIREATKPYVDPAAIARELREREISRQQFNEARKITKAMQEACPHKDKNEKWAINLQHNFPDHQPRGICPHCNYCIEPAHWVIPGAGFDGGNGAGQPYIVSEDKLYYIVRQLESMA
jgi:hypothetical protein